MPQRPNIVFLLNDHQLYYRHGWDQGILPQRPNFYRLAREGVSFERSYAVSPLCGPARRTLLTGLYPHNHKNYYNYSDAPFDEEVYLDLLAQAGYRNYYYGKWHAGPGTALDHHCEGFSLPAYGNPYITAAYQAYLERHGLPPAAHSIERVIYNNDFLKQFPNLKEGKLDYRCDSFWCGENAVGLTTTPKETHEAFFLADLACEQLEKLAAEPGDAPFSLRVDFWGPHPPYFPTQEFLDLYDPQQIAGYGSFRDDLDAKPEVYRHVDRPLGDQNGMLIQPSVLPWPEWQRVLAHAYAHITLVDAAGGLILDRLDELGLAENTIVIWTTDHGDAVASHGGLWDKGSYMTEEVLRVPLAVRYPGMIPAGSVSRELVNSNDIAPTILDAAGLQFGSPVDGSSLLPLFTGEEVMWRKDMMLESAGHGYRDCMHARALIWDDIKYISNQDDIDELYDLERDPYELTNRIGDAAYQERLDHARERLAVWMARTGDEGAALK